MSHPFHSALHPPIEQEVRETLFDRDGNLAFVADLEQDVPSAYSRCDVIYTEPAWRLGYEKFAVRAGTPGLSWPTYIRNHLKFIDLGVPVYMVGGAHMTSLLTPKPDEVRSIVVDSGGSKITDALLFAWGGAIPDGATSTGMIEALALLYRRVGDPGCGYGNTGRIFRAAGKRFVMSDVDPHCISYIATAYDGWAS